jgi:hypothetical protein
MADDEGQEPDVAKKDYRGERFVFATRDGGVSWTEASARLPE